MAAPHHHGDDYTAVLAGIKTDFDQRLARMADQPEQWVRFLEQAATFGAQYSLGNQILLATQAEQRGITARWFLPYGRKDGSTGWRAHGRWVRAGQKAFRIWAPVRRRPTDDEARDREAAGHTVAREPSGRPARHITGFRLARTFELSQTDGTPFTAPTVAHRRLTHRPHLLTGPDPTGAYDDLVALITAAGYTYQLTAPGAGYLGAANGITVTRGRLRLVQVRDDVDPAQRTKTTMHELAHLRCGHPEAADRHRGRRETEAESITHIVLKALGLDTAGYSDAYVLGWAGGNLTVVKDCADTVLRVARQILRELTPAHATNPADPPPADTSADEQTTGEQHR